MESLQELSTRRREFARKMVDRIAEDEEFRDLILDDPVAAVERAGLVEEHDELVEGFYDVKVDDDEEVQGFASFSLGISPIQPRPSVPTRPSAGPNPLWSVAPSCSFPTSGSSCG